MINTRVLEQRLGWHSSTPDGEPAPPARPIGHKVVLQGRVEHDQAAPRGSRRAAIEEAWESLARVNEDPAVLAERARLVPSFVRGSTAGAALDHLRTQMMRALRDNDWRRVGVTSPGRGAGRSFIAAGLAASVARLEGNRVLLIDGDLEAPGLAELFGVEPPGALESFLSGRRTVEDQTVRLGPDLAVVMNDSPVITGADLIQSPDAILALKALQDTLGPDVTVVDLPPLLGQPVAEAWLPQLDAVLLISDGRANTAQEIIDCERQLEGQVPILGIAMNKTEDRDPRPSSRRRR
jgi:Mrp family chromosome partitioning ATPase